ncbi:DUF2946 family protein [Pseudorhodoplanes sp.]|uniref:DUF2946 family protein n=1 Tax=Pseudorhodoplanes sp. TaxID=1934341 RepID=UPI00391DC4FA
MTGLRESGRFRAAIGLIAAYAIALQALFAAFAPLPAHAKPADIASWSALCFGGGNPSPDGDPAAPASGKFHCVLCGSALAAAAILPEPATNAAPVLAAAGVLFGTAPQAAPARQAIRPGQARAPPLTV